MTKRPILLTILAVIALSAAVALASSMNYGAKTIVIDGGKQGSVTFPHEEHQEELKDCDVCHKVFPKEQGSILAMKEKGELDRKQVMNGTCLDCHRAMKKAGKETGPTSCSQCHKR